MPKILLSVLGGFGLTKIWVVHLGHLTPCPKVAPNKETGDHIAIEVNFYCLK